MNSIARRMAPTSSPGGRGTVESKSAERAIFLGDHSALAHPEVGQCRYRSFRHLEILAVQFKPNAIQPASIRSSYCRNATHKWVQEFALAQLKRRANNLAHKMLRLQRRMAGNFPLAPPRWRRVNQ